MYIIPLIIVYWTVMKMLAEYESTNQKIRRMDNDPNCSIKSDRWKREHGQL